MLTWCTFASTTVPPLTMAPSTGGIQKKSKRKLACTMCQQRKKKCDRQSPCSLCIKASPSPQNMPGTSRRQVNHGSQNNIVCTPSTPKPPRRRRKPTQELVDCLERWEGMLRQCLDQNVHTDSEKHFFPQTGERQATNDEHTAASSSTTSPSNFNTTPDEPQLIQAESELSEIRNIKLPDRTLWG